MYNPRTGETFPAGTEFDPKTGEKLIKRPDDEENAIKQRIKEFYEKTLPVVNLYEQE
jgi:adenylate kinase family enzyme